MRTLNPYAVAMLMLLPVISAATGAGWQAPRADARTRLLTKGDLYGRRGAAHEVVIDFNELLGAHRVLAAGSLSLVSVEETKASSLDAAFDQLAAADRVAAADPPAFPGAKSGKAPSLDIAQDAEIRYASGNPILRLRWAGPAMKPFQERAWRLYFRTVKPGSPDAWRPIRKTFTPREPGIVFSTSFEEPRPAKPHWPRTFAPAGRDKPGQKTERVWTDKVARTGKRCLKIARTSDGKPPRNTNRPFWWVWPLTIEVRPGKTYRLGAWIKTARVPLRSTAIVSMVFRDGKQARLIEGRISMQAGPAVGPWKYVSGSALAPLGARYAEIHFSLHGDGEVYCDDLSLSAISGAELPALPIAVGRVEERSEFTVADRGKDRETRKELNCGVAKAPPKLDGALNDPCWRNAGRIRDFETFFRLPHSKVTTTVLACADREALYFGFECTEPSTKDLVAKADKRDGPVWADDSVELFLDTNLDRRTYYQIIVNPKGVFFDQDKGARGLAGAKWNGPIKVAAKVWPDRWTAEVRLRFAGLRLAEAAGRLWGANFTRSSMRGGRSLYSWVKVKKNFGEPERFGRIILPFDPSANAVTGRALGENVLFWGQGALPFEINNKRDRPVRVRVVVKAETDKGLTPLGEVRPTVKSRSVATVGLRCALAPAGEIKLRYEVFEEPGARLLYTTLVTHTVPPPLDVSLSSLVLYLDEKRLGVDWRLGVSEDVAPRCALSFQVLPKGSDAPLVRMNVSPRGRVGASTLDVGRLPLGRYRLRAELACGKRVVDRRDFSFERVMGPFGK